MYQKLIIKSRFLTIFNLKKEENYKTQLLKNLFVTKKKRTI